MNPEPTQTPNASLTLNVTGMTCGHCVRTIERAVAKVPGVQTARVDLAAETLTFGGSAPRALVVDAIRKVGYDVQEN